ncbi:MAG: glycosyltransferase family 4 protein [Hyphomicrobiaceae bacterium]
MAVIFVNRFFYPDHSATSQMLSDLAFALAQKEETVTVITSRLRYDDPAVHLPDSETVRNVTVKRVWTSRFGRHNLVGRVFDYATFYISAAWAVFHLAQNGDIVISKTDPPMLGVLTGAIARARGAKTANWLQDIFPEVAEAVGMGDGRLSGALFSALRKLRDRSLRNSDATIAIGERMAALVKRCGVAKGKVRVIPNWADCDSVVPVSPSENRLRASWGFANAFVVGYSGNLGRTHEIETLLNAIGHLEAKRENHPTPIRWLFIGGGAQFDTLKSECAARGLSSVSFQPYQPRERLALSLSVADVHLVSLRPELEGLIVPSKFYGVAAAGRAAIFIGDADGEVARLIAEEHCGLTVAQGDGAALAQAIETLAADPVLCRALGESGRRAAEKRFALSTAVISWQDLLAALREKSL